MTKACNTCGETKALNEFHRDGSLRSGYRGRCKVCAAVKDHERRSHPCMTCGGPKPPGHGWRYCDGCRRPSEVKRCDGCGETKPIDNFYAHLGRHDGHRAECKACFGAKVEKRLADPAVRARKNAADRRAYWADPEVNREVSQRWRDANRDRFRATLRRIYRENPGRWADASATRKARKLAAFVEHVDRTRVLSRHDGICGICSQPVAADDFHVDHIVPLARGGEHSYANTQPAHPICNLRKGVKELDRVAA